MKYHFALLSRCISTLLFFFFFLSVSSQPILNYTTKVSGLSFPVDIVNAGDGSGRLFIVQQNGLIVLYKGSDTTTFLNITSLIPFDVTNEERGLLSMAFHPDYDGVTNRFFFVYYTTTTAGLTTIRVARYTTAIGNPDIASTDPPNEVIAIPKPGNQSNHNGGKLNFGADGMLYFGTGDGGSGNDPNNNAQNGTSLLGKMLRIDINGTDSGFYSIPPGNPYFGNDGIKDEIWAFGLRNPFRWSFDPVTNAMWIGDVGQGQREEVDVRLPSPTTGGVNYGWRCYEGTLQPPPGITACNPLPSDYVPPIYEYTHNGTTGGFAITGGYVYRGSNPLLYGYYVFADYVSGNVWVMDLAGTATQQSLDRSNISGFGVGENGTLYALGRGTSGGTGRLDSIGASLTLPLTLVSFTGRNMNGYNELRWSTSFEQNTDKYIIEYSTDGNSFTPAGEVIAANNTSGSTYSYRHNITGASRIFYRLLMRDLDGSSRYSSVIVIGGNIKGDIKLRTTVVQNNMLEFTATTAVDRVMVYDAQGKQISGKDLNSMQGYFSVQLPGNLAKGIYFVMIQGKDYRKTEKFVLQ
jgi:glucose/arabinose dehydrogenase